MSETDLDDLEDENESNLVSHIRKLQYIYVALSVFLIISSTRLFFSDSVSAKLSSEIVTLKRLFTRSSNAWIDDEIKRKSNLHKKNYSTITFPSATNAHPPINIPMGLVFTSGEMDDLKKFATERPEVTDLMNFVFPSLLAEKRGILPIYDDSIKNYKNNLEVVFEKLSLGEVRDFWNLLYGVKKIQIIGSPNYIGYEDVVRGSGPLALNAIGGENSSFNTESIFRLKYMDNESELHISPVEDSMKGHEKLNDDYQFWAFKVPERGYLSLQKPVSVVVFVTDHHPTKIQDELKQSKLFLVTAPSTEEEIDLINAFFNEAYIIGGQSGDFNQTFPALSTKLKGLDGIEMKEIEEFGETFEENSLDSERVEALGFQIEGKMVFAFLAIFILVVQVYLLVHLHNLVENLESSKKQFNEWLVSFNGSLAKGIAYGALVWTPLFAYLSAFLVIWYKAPDEKALRYLILVIALACAFFSYEMYKRLNQLRSPVVVKPKEIKRPKKKR